LTHPGSIKINHLQKNSLNIPTKELVKPNNLATERK
jgi:hypothetical protein